jgi:hypothetical protein
MKREEMNNIVQEELERIPRDIKGSDQNAFRMLFNVRRRNDLSMDQPEGFSTVVAELAEQMRKKSPGFMPVIK